MSNSASADELQRELDIRRARAACEREQKLALEHRQATRCRKQVAAAAAKVKASEGVGEGSAGGKHSAGRSSASEGVKEGSLKEGEGVKAREKGKAKEGARSESGVAGSGGGTLKTVSRDSDVEIVGEGVVGPKPSGECRTNYVVLC